MHDYRNELQTLRKRHDSLICIDSDGTVFDTMAVKHRFFCDCMLRCFGFRGRDAERAAEIWNSVNLHSVHRGENRFHSILLVFDILKEYGIEVPDTSRLRAWTAEETHLGNPALRALLERDPSEEMSRIYQWSLQSDEAIAANVRGMKPFPLVRETLERASVSADIMVVSHTPCETLDREWNEHGIARYAMYLAGQECGSKKEHVRLASQGKYSPGRILVIGDSHGDLAAAEANHALFFPVIPGRETESWRELSERGLGLFLGERFSGKYQKDLLEQFRMALPA